MITSSYNKIKGIYNSLMDNESKMIFEQRLLYSLTGNHSYIAEMAYRLYKDYHSSLEGEFWEFIKKLPSKEHVMHKKVIIFGAGINGRILFEFINKCGYKIDFFCDNDVKKQGTNYCGLPVLSPKELVQKYTRDTVVIGIQNHSDEVQQQLLALGINQDNIINGGPVFGRQYFDNCIFEPSEEEIFIDGGCYDGGSTLDFIDWCHGNYKKIYAFEPDTHNFHLCTQTLEKKKVKKCQLIKKGLWSKKATLKFTNSGGGDSSISDKGTFMVEVESIDQILDGDKVTFVKMDIEGSELAALEGAKQTIQDYRPKLAICIYHKEEDLIDILLYIKSIMPDYKFYIRHYSLFQVETVLYAI